MNTTTTSSASRVGFRSVFNPHGAGISLRTFFALLLCFFAASDVQAQKGKPGGGSGGDIIAPDPLDPVEVGKITFTNIYLYANMTADDGSDPGSGNAYSVEIRYREDRDCSFSPDMSTPSRYDGTAIDNVTGAPCFNDANWSSLKGRSFTSPPAPGETAVFWPALAGNPPLTPGTTYLLALRVVDEVPNRSAISAVIRAATDSPGNYDPWGSPSAVLATVTSSTSASLAFDEAGNPAVAYTPTSQEVRFLHSTSRASDGVTPVWPGTAERIEAARALGWAVRLAYNPAAGSFGVAYGGTGVVKYAERAPAGWALKLIEEKRNTNYDLGALHFMGSSTMTGRRPLFSYKSPAGLKLARRLGPAPEDGWSTLLPSPLNPAASEHATGANPLNPATVGIAYTVTESVTGGTMHRLYFSESVDGGQTWSSPEFVDASLARPFPGNTSLWGASIGSLRLTYDPQLGEPVLLYRTGPAYFTRVVLKRRVNGTWSDDPTWETPWGGYAGGLAFDGDELYVAWSNEGDFVSHRDAASGNWKHELVSMTSGFASIAAGGSGPALVRLHLQAADVYELHYVPRARPGMSPALAAVLKAPSELAAPTSAEVPDDYELSPAYPNPFNPTTHIRFAMPEAGPATLIVYDALGRQVALLVNSNLESGWHQARFDASGLPSGVYLYRLTAGSFSKTQRMVLIQ